MLAEELERLKALRDSGALTEEEFEHAKQKVLGGQSAVRTDEILGLKIHIWCALMHLSQLLWWTGAGIIVPIVMWIIGRDQSRVVDTHGRIILNWMLSSIIYGAISGVLTFVLIGIPMLWVLAASTFIFPIIGTIRAIERVPWKYWLSIEFLRVDDEDLNEAL